jgi:hypothetical protein
MSSAGTASRPPAVNPQARPPARLLASRVRTAGGALVPKMVPIHPSEARTQWPPRPTGGRASAAVLCTHTPKGRSPSADVAQSAFQRRAQSSRKPVARDCACAQGSDRPGVTSYRKRCIEQFEPSTCGGKAVLTSTPCPPWLHRPAVASCIARSVQQALPGSKWGAGVLARSRALPFGADCGGFPFQRARSPGAEVARTPAAAYVGFVFQLSRSHAIFAFRTEGDRRREPLKQRQTSASWTHEHRRTWQNGGEGGVSECARVC